MRQGWVNADRGPTKSRRVAGSLGCRTPSLRCSESIGSVKIKIGRTLGNCEWRAAGYSRINVAAGGAEHRLASTPGRRCCARPASGISATRCPAYGGDGAPGAGGARADRDGDHGLVDQGMAARYQHVTDPIRHEVAAPSTACFGSIMDRNETAGLSALPGRHRRWSIRPGQGGGGGI